MLLPLIKQNLSSGCTVALVSISMAITLAVASGARPDQGIVTAIIGGIVMCLLGSNNYNIVGPAASLVSLVIIAVQQEGLAALPIITVCVGITILLAALMRIERFLVFLPTCAIHGITIGIGLALIINQIPAALGIINPSHHGASPINILCSVIFSLHKASLPIGLLCLFFFSIMLISVFFFKFAVGSIILAPLSIITGFCINKFGLITPKLPLLGDSVHTLGLSLQLPVLSMFKLGFLTHIIPLALIAIIEILIAGKMADSLTKTRHDSNRELYALGVVNIITGFVGGLPATAALARTAMNIKMGCTNKISAGINGIVVLLIALIFFNFFSYMPRCAIAAILLFVGTKMIDVHKSIMLFKTDRKEFFIAMLAAVLVICDNPLTAILCGSALAMLIFMERISHGHREILVNQSASHDHVLTYSIKGQLAYINAQSHRMHFELQQEPYKNIVLNLSELSFIDSDGIEALLAMIETTSINKKILTIHTGNSPIKATLDNITNFQNPYNKRNNSLHDSDISRHANTGTR